MIKFIIIFTIIFVFFIEYYVGNILFRRNASNNLTINIMSMIHYLLHPLYNNFLWNRNIICTNYPFMLLLAMITYSLF